MRHDGVEREELLAALGHGCDNVAVAEAAASAAPRTAMVRQDASLHDEQPDSRTTGRRLDWARPESFEATARAASPLARGAAHPWTPKGERASPVLYSVSCVNNP